MSQQAQQADSNYISKSCCDIQNPIHRVKQLFLSRLSKISLCLRKIVVSSSSKTSRKIGGFPGWSSPNICKLLWILLSLMSITFAILTIAFVVSVPQNYAYSSLMFSSITFQPFRSVAAKSVGKMHVSEEKIVPYDKEKIEKRVRAALWSYFAGDALASPTHWFYGGFPQVQRYYGRNGITGYTKPVYEMAGSILNKSNLSGGGRTTTFVSRGNRVVSARNGETTEMPPTIIGHVINHGKQGLWDPSKEIHYHATLAAGENTLEVQLARVLLRSIASTGGIFNADHFRELYVTFMTTSGSHNDTYASTCHRMFFANLIYKQLPPIKCPDNDSHNVDTIDGLVLPTITALAVAARPDGTIDEAATNAAATAAVTRRSKLLEKYASEWGKLVFKTVRCEDGEAIKTVRAASEAMAHALSLRQPSIRASDEITACYLDSAVPAMLDSIVKYTSAKTTVWDALLANANTGGENVHRGSCLGAVLGATLSTEGATEKNDSTLTSGLHDRSSIEREIQLFLDSVASKG